MSMSSMGFLHIQMLYCRRSEALQKPSSTWKAPVDGWHKANRDAALDPSNGHLGVGIVTRDRMGGVLATKCMHMQGHMEPTAAKALAAYHAVRLSKDVGVANLVLEGDAQNVVHGYCKRQ
ncbi:hypothetical protein FH972_012550 [Carpinus fangiana]|uniref:RNase H type-1 domain-containing protein n=1 Tax=Carpinus fangiana TaxID=176857 RepID=A0A5N6R7A8_9ROSI|nr:hypothetical protein FH972_012550 [Carpinus fangiana]